MDPNASWDVLSLLATDFVLLPDTSPADEALRATLKRPGRLGLVQGKAGALLAYLDSCTLERALAGWTQSTTPVVLADLPLPKPCVLPVTASVEALLQAFNEDAERTVVAQDHTGSIAGYLSPSRFLRWLLGQQTAMAAKVSQLQQALEQRDEYLGMVVHDLRAPLSVIQLAIDYVRLPEHQSAMSVQVRSFVERIKRNTDHAQFLVRGLLEAVRSQAPLQLSFEQVVFGELIDEVVRSLDIVAQQKEQSIVAEHLDTLQVLIDAGRIRQVIENLLMNAIKYAPVKSQITLQSFLEEHDGTLYAVCKLSNPGRAISAAAGRRLFEPFVQGDGALALKDGVGLGLSIVHKLVERHEGFIEVGSDKPNEVCFRVYLPNATRLEEMEAIQNLAKGQSILVVDDDEVIRDFAEAGLTAAGFHVLTAENGARAFSLFKRHQPQLILSDVRMNQVDGFELLAKVREASPDTPVILCSGFYAGLDRTLKDATLKPSLFVDKPLRMNELVRNISRLLQKSKPKPDNEPPG